MPLRTNAAQNIENKMNITLNAWKTGAATPTIFETFSV